MSSESLEGLIALVIIVVVICLIVRHFKRASLKKYQIVDRWEALIEQGSGNTDDVYQVIDDALKSAEPPSVSWDRQEIQAGGILAGRRYDGLVVVNSYLRDYRIYVFAYDYGTSLHTAWFLTFQPSFAKRPQRYDIPQELELSAYTTTVHRATKKAVQVLMGKLEQDFSVINTRSKGSLGLW